MTTLGTTLEECDFLTRSAYTIGSSVSIEESMWTCGLIEERAARSACRTGVERQFARVALLIVRYMTRPLAADDVRTGGSPGERCPWICDSRIDDIDNGAPVLPQIIKLAPRGLVPGKRHTA